MTSLSRRSLMWALPFLGLSLAGWIPASYSQVTNILSNSGFESGTTLWTFSTNGRGSFSSVVGGTEGSRAGRVRITTQGTTVLLYQSGLTLEAGATYKLNFDGYCTTGHDVDISVVNGSATSTTYGLAATRFDLGTAWKSDSVSFTASGFTGTVTNARLMISFGPYDAASDDFFFDRIVFGKVVAPSAPTIVTQPQSQTVTVGQTATFLIVATGTAPLTYQWQKNAVNISGATGASYTTPATVQTDNGATYRCVVSNGLGPVTSNAAVLTVNAAPSSGIVSDDFSGTTLNSSIWTFVNLRNDVSIALVGTGTANAQLSLAVPSGIVHDTWTGGMTAPRMMQSVANVDFEVEVKFDSPMTSGYQMQGILVQQDATNFIRFDFVRDGSGLWFYSGSFVNDVPTVRANTGITLSSPYYLRVKRTGNQWTASYSANGTSWTQAVTFSHALTVSRIGPWVGNAGNTPPAFTGLIDYFFNTASPISPEDPVGTPLPPTITTQPAGQTVTVGQTATFTVVATGTGPITYQWQKNAVNISGATAASYTTPATVSADSGASFRVLVRNAAGSDTSVSAALRVTQPVPVAPAITTQPVNQTVSAGQTATFTVAASGTAPLTYQWQKNTVNITGANSASYTTPVTVLTDNGSSFRCVVTNSANAVTSNAAVLTVNAVPASGIVSDDFSAGTLNPSIWTFINPRNDVTMSLVGTGTANARLSLAVPAGQVHDTWTGGMTAPRIMQAAANLDFEVEVKFDAAMTTGYQMQGILVQQNATNFIRFDLVRDGSGLWFYSGSFVNDVPTLRANTSITLSAPYYLRVKRAGNQWTASYSANGTSWTQAVTFSHTLTVASVGPWVGNAGGSPPAFTGLIDYFFNTAAPISPEDPVGPPTAPTITTEPVSQSVTVGQTATFSVVATGTSPLTYQWQKNALNINGATGASFTTPATVAADSGAAFRVMVTNTAGSDTSVNAVLRVTQPAPVAPGITTQPVSQTVTAGQTATFSIAASGTAPLTYQWQKNAVNISGATNTSYTTPVTVQTDNGSTFRCVVTNSVSAVTSNAAGLTVNAVPTSGIVSDDFSGSTISPSVWTFMNPRNDVTLSLVGTGTANARLSLAVPAGQIHDTWTGGMTAPRVMQSVANVDFEVEVKFDAGMTTGYQMQGVLVQQDATNFLRFDLVRDGSGLWFYSGSFVNDVPTLRANTSITLSAPYYLRVKRAGSQWTASYSANGTSWTQAVTFSHVLTVSSLGPWVGNAGGSPPAFTGLVDYFFNTAAPISPEDPVGPPVAPTIITEPVSQTVTVGQTATFTVVATGTSPLTYQWRRNALNISGATAATYTTPMTTLSNNGEIFACIVTNALGADTSANATSTVSPRANGGSQIPFQHIIVDASGVPSPACKALGDLDGDGFPDIVAASSTDSTAGLVWYRYPQWKKYAMARGIYTTEMKLADIDGDGDLDVLIPRGTYDAATICWYENPMPAAAPTTAPWKMHVIGDEPGHDISAGDIDRDGRIDVVVRNRFRTVVFFQTAADVWSRANISTRATEGLALADIDGDGDLDAVINGYWLQNPLPTTSPRTGTWTERTIAASWPSFAKAYAVDLNNDGRMDVLLTGSEVENTHFSWFETTSPLTGPWIEHTIDTTLSYLHGIAVADLDLDGYLDVLTAEMHQSSDPDIVSIYRNGGTSLSWTREVLATTGSHNMVVGDIGSDGDVDVLGANWEATATNDAPIEYWENLLRATTFNLNNWSRHVVDNNRPWRAMFITSADIDRDNRPDIVTGGWWYKNPGVLSNPWVRTTIGSPLNNMATVYDFNHDGAVDILGTKGVGEDPSAEFVWARNNGSGGFTILNNIANAEGDFLQGVAVSTFSHDTTAVALSWHEAGHGIQLLIPLARPDTGTWSWRRISTTSQDEQLSAADIDRDGDIDLMLGTQWLRNGSSGWTPVTLNPTTDPPDRNRLGDINHDGRVDVVVGFEAMTGAGKLAWYEQGSDPTATWPEHVIASLQAGPMSVDLADMDGDGDLDVVVGEHHNPAVGGERLLVYENLDSVGGRWEEHVVYSGDEHHDGAQIVDIDNDGDLDIISIGWTNTLVVLYENLAIHGNFPVGSRIPAAPVQLAEARETAGPIPDRITLMQNFPNPFNPTTTIRFGLPGTGSTLVRLDVYDILGRQVAELVHEPMMPGWHAVTFDARGLASGVYFYRMHAGDVVETRRFLLLK